MIPEKGMKRVAMDAKRKCKHCGKYNSYELTVFYLDRALLDRVQRAMDAAYAVINEG